MADEKMEELATRISVADVSSAIAFGLQRAIEGRLAAGTLNDHIIYGGRIDFNIQILPQVGTQEIRSINEG